MLNQQHMNEKAQAVYHFIPGFWTTPIEVSEVTGITTPQCQMILTQLAMAGLVEDLSGTGEYFRRCG